MKHTQFDYVNQFHCLAGHCPDTCCKDWQIILDEDAMARYRAMPGALGEQVRAAMLTQNGETRFREQDGKCVLLREDGLCPIQAAYGAEALCRTCFTHPRFTEEYGQTAELTLSASCPAAARLLLEHEAPLRLETTDDGGPVVPNELDPTLYLALLSARTAAIRLAQDRTRSFEDRLALVLLGVALLWIFAANRLFLTAVHPQLASSRGIPTEKTQALFTVCIAVVVTLAMSWVGLMVINSLLVLPAASSRNITRNLREYHLLSVLGALVCSVGGLVTAYYLGCSAGATIALYLALYFTVTFFFRNTRQ